MTNVVIGATLLPLLLNKVIKAAFSASSSRFHHCIVLVFLLFQAIRAFSFFPSPPTPQCPAVICLSVKVYSETTKVSIFLINCL